MKIPTQSKSISRRQAIRLLLSAGALAMTTPAYAITQDDVNKTESELASAQAKLEEVDRQLDEIAGQYEELSINLAGTLENIDGVNSEISSTEQQIEEKEAELASKRESLAKRMRSAYKAGGNGALAALLSSTSLEEFESNVYYLDKITESDRMLIEDVDSLKGELEQHQVDLEANKASLEELKGQQEQQLADMQAKQEEVQAIFDGLDADVQELISKRDDQIMQLSRERAEQKKREEEARQAQSSASTSTGGQSGAADLTSGQFSDGSTTGSQQRVIAACKTTGSPGGGLCAMWVSMVFNNAGFGYAGGNANDMYNAWTTSSNRADLKPGMSVAVSTHSHTSAGRIYGHIGIYIGNGIMMDNIGYIRTISVNEWVNFYSTTVTPRWGWLMGIVLT